MTSPTVPRLLMLLFATSFVSFSGSAQEKSGKENLFKNASFAEGMKDWNIKAQPGNTAEIDNTELRDGRPTLKIHNANGSHTQVSQKIAVKPNTRYRITAYIKTKDATPVKRDSKRGASIGVANGPNSKYFYRTEPWSKVDLDFDSGGATEMTMGPQLGVYFDAVAGTAWFADLTLVEVGRARK